jgi:hypothetical protein
MPGKTSRRARQTAAAKISLGWTKRLVKTIAATHLDTHGCVVAPSAEPFLKQKCFPYDVPIKGFQKQRLFALNALSYSDDSREISRQVVLDQFGAHNKRIGVEVLPKINNTIIFLEACKREIATQL